MLVLTGGAACGKTDTAGLVSPDTTHLPDAAI
jgi:hypothetical protein